MNELILYDRACTALAQAKKIDEVKDVRDKAMALKAYAKVAKNKELEADAAEIRVRAERRVGEMMRLQAETIGLNKGAEGSGVQGRVDPTPTLAEAGIDKNLAKVARKLCAMDDETFEHFIHETRGAVSKAIHSALRAKTKAADRAEKEEALARTIMKLPEKRFGVLLMDAPWRFETYSEKGKDRAADNHYPTMSMEELEQLDINSIAAKHCALFMWATVPFLSSAIGLMEWYGFDYKSNYVWVKRKAKNQTGTGYWVRDRHELLLVGTRGNIPAPAPGEQWESVIAAATSKHSEKPDEVHTMIEAYFPKLPKIELFARKPRDGWTVWGNEVGS